MATIIIKRKSEMVNRFRSIKILLNGQEKLTIGNNEAKNIVIPEGSYTLQAKIDWTGSAPMVLNLKESDHVVYEMGCVVHQSKLTIGLSILSILVLLGSILFYEKITATAWVLLVILWLLRDVIYTKGKSMFYYLTVGRYKYLYLKPINNFE